MRKVGKSAHQSGCNDFEKEFLLEHFYYDKGILYWQTTGSVAGSKNKNGYWVISKGKKIRLGSSKNFFDAVCLRKSWEASLWKTED